MNMKNIINTTILALFFLLPYGVLAEQNKEHSDGWLEAKLETTYLFNPHINFFDIDVEVKNGVAYLSGKVEESIDKNLAGEIARSVEGITSVKNNLVVTPGEREKRRLEYQAKKEPSFFENVTDATITAGIKSKLLWNRHTDGLDIKVTTKRGVVTLEGTTDSSESSELAELIAKNTSGVKDVKNNLNVKADSKEALGKIDLDQVTDNAKSTAAEVEENISDGWISTKVRSTLAFSSDVDSSYIDVTTNKGVVTLQGTALTTNQKDRAEEIARDIKGVKDVQNSLSVIGKKTSNS